MKLAALALVCWCTAAFASLSPPLRLEYGGERVNDSPVLFFGPRAEPAIAYSGNPYPDVFTEYSLLTSQGPNLSYNAASAYAEYLLTPQIDASLKLSAISVAFGENYTALSLSPELRYWLSQDLSLAYLYTTRSATPTDFSFSEHRAALSFLYFSYAYLIRAYPSQTYFWHMVRADYYDELSGDWKWILSGGYFEGGFVSVGVLWSPAGENDEAPLTEKRLERLALFDPDDAEVNYELGILYHRQNRFEKSTPLFEKTIAKDPGRLEAYYLLAYGYYQLKNPQKARAILEQLYSRRKDPLVREILRGK